MKDFYKKILDNNKEWVEQSLAKDPNYFQDIAKGQTPPLLWIGCSDSRVPANEIIGAKPGEVQWLAEVIIHAGLNTFFPFPQHRIGRHGNNRSPAIHLFFHVADQAGVVGGVCGSDGPVASGRVWRFRRAPCFCLARLHAAIHRPFGLCDDECRNDPVPAIALG
jgi:hypothetical protein